jgi:hypothetical protein
VQPASPLLIPTGQGFRNPIIRSLLAGNSSGGRIVIGSNIPTELTTFYVTNYSATPVAAALFYRNATDYFYELVSETGAVNRATGWGVKNVNTSLVEIWQETAESFPNPSVPARASVLYTDPTAGHGPIVSMDANSSFTIEPGAAWKIDDIDAPRGLVGSVATISDSALIGTTETVMLTMTSRTYAANRAFMVAVGNRSQGDTIGNAGQYQLRKTNTAGTRLCVFGDTGHVVANIGFMMSAVGFFVTSAAATSVIVLTLFRNGGLGNVQHLATFTTRFMNIYDVGNAANVDASFAVLT